jgi:murein DD-endopeptidase MepM/ murein hydrolase activator NlpD
LKTAVAVGAVVMVILSAVFVDYVGLLMGAGENKRLKAENSVLKRQFQLVESKLSSFENNIERITTLEKRLRMITNIEDTDRALKLSLGPLPRSGQAFPENYQQMADRAPTSEFLTDDSFEEPTDSGVDEAKGELVVEKQRDYESLAIRIDRFVKETQLREQGLQQLWDTLSERESLLSATPSIKPAVGWYTSRFGYRSDPFTGRPLMHAGLDIAAPPGSPIHATANGVVSYVGYDPGYGNLVSIDHGYGVVTRFGHTSRIFVEKGQTVHRRDVIAAVGSTGRSSGPHVHYEVRVHGVPVDPRNYILDDE